MGAKWYPIGVACLSLLGSAVAHASFIGHDVRASAFFPDIGILAGPPATVTVGAGLEFDEFPAGNRLLDADLGATTIDIAFVITGGVSSANFAGVVFDDVFGTIPEIVDVSILNTTEPQFDPSRISFSTNSISLNFQGFSDVANDNISLSVTFVPEPTTAALLAAGLAAVGFHARRKARRWNVVSQNVDEILP